MAKRRIKNIEKKLSALEKEMQRQRVERVEIRDLNYPYESLKQAFEEIFRQNSHE